MKCLPIEEYLQIFVCVCGVCLSWWPVRTRQIFAKIFRTGSRNGRRFAVGKCREGSCGGGEVQGVAMLFERRLAREGETFSRVVC